MQPNLQALRNEHIESTLKVWVKSNDHDIKNDIPLITLQTISILLYALMIIL